MLSAADALEKSTPILWSRLGFTSPATAECLEHGDLILNQGGIG
jgi:hypothetical protein